MRSHRAALEMGQGDPFCQNSWGFCYDRPGRSHNTDKQTLAQTNKDEQELQAGDTEKGGHKASEDRDASQNGIQGDLDGSATN